MRHILFAISPHGFGHAAMVAPLINELQQRDPSLRITLRTTLSPEFLSSRIQGAYKVQYAADDFGMVQHNALEVDVEASAKRYRDLHRDWDAHVVRVARELESCGADLVVADVPYLTLAAAQRAGIPNVALCCLHWGDIYDHYCHTRPEAIEIHAQIMQAYRGATHFLRTEPAMPMAGLDNQVTIGPLARAGINRREELAQRLKLREDERLILVAMGGIGYRLPMERWPVIPNVRFIVQTDWQVVRDDTVTLESLSLPFADLVASCDVLLTKPGYGSFSEAAVNGTPVLYVPRDDWPESAWLVRWLERNGRCAAIERGTLERGEIATAIESLLMTEQKIQVSPSGIAQAIALLANFLPGASLIP